MKYLVIWRSSRRRYAYRRRAIALCESYAKCPELRDIPYQIGGRVAHKDPESGQRMLALERDCVSHFLPRSFISAGHVITPNDPRQGRNRNGLLREQPEDKPVSPSEYFLDCGSLCVLGTCNLVGERVDATVILSEDVASEIAWTPDSRRLPATDAPSFENVNCRNCVREKDVRIRAWSG